MGPPFWRALEFADDNLPVVEVVNHPRFQPVQTNEAQPPIIWLTGNNRANSSSLPSPFCSVNTTVRSLTSGATAWQTGRWPWS